MNGWTLPDQISIRSQTAKVIIPRWTEIPDKVYESQMLFAELILSFPFGCSVERSSAGSVVEMVWSGWKAVHWSETAPLLLNLALLIIMLCLHVWFLWVHTHHSTRWRSEDNFVKLAHSFHLSVGLGHGSQVVEDRWVFAHWAILPVLMWILLH